MRISFSPQRRDGALTVAKTGEVLTINGEAFDFAGLPDGATIPAGSVPCEWIVGPVDRANGELYLTIVLPHGPNAPQSVAFPEPITVTVDGPVAIPQGE